MLVLRLGYVCLLVFTVYSTMSASLNTVAGTIYEDFLQFVLKDKKVTDKQHNFVIKLIVLVLGLVCIALVFIVERLGTLFQVRI